MRLPALRRHLMAITWMVLGLHALGVAASTTQVCRHREHTHRGVAAPDCPLHHQADPDSQPMAHHAHHGDRAPIDGQPNGGARLSCWCAGDIIPIVFGQSAILPAAQSPSSLVQGVVLDVVSAPSVREYEVSPPSPPPR